MTDKTNKTSKTNQKRLSQGLRTHIRRLKQKARKEGTVYRSPTIHHTPAKTAGE
jgi:RNA processing factor Prp31